MRDKAFRKEEILNAAYRILSQKAFRDTTIKEIADSANANIAAINYYFGSKDALVELVIEKYINESYKLFSILEDVEKPPLQRLKEYSVRYMDLASSYILRTVTLQFIGENKIIPKIMESFTLHVKVLVKVIIELTGLEDERKSILKAIQYFSNLTYPMLAVQYSAEASGMDFYKPEIREEYIDMLICNVFNLSKDGCSN